MKLKFYTPKVSYTTKETSTSPEQVSKPITAQVTVQVSDPEEMVSRQEIFNNMIKEVQREAISDKNLPDISITDADFEGGQFESRTLYSRNTGLLPAPPIPAPQPTTSPLLPLEQVIYTDYAFEIEQPQFLKAMQSSTKGANTISSLYFDFDPIYNFYVQAYEESTSRFQEFGGRSLLPEFILPNLYVFLAELDIFQSPDPSSVTTTGPFGSTQIPAVRTRESYQHVTLGNRLTKLLVDYPDRQAINIAFGSVTGRNPQGPIFQDLSKQIDFGSYYEEWSNTIKTLRQQITTQQTIPQSVEEAQEQFLSLVETEFSNLSTFKNLIVPFSSLDLLKDFSNRKVLFPMYVDVELKPTGMKRSPIAAEFYQAGLMALLMKEVSENVGVAPNGSVATTWNKWIKFDRASAISPIGESEEFDDLSINKYYRYWDIGDFLMNDPSLEQELLGNRNLIIKNWSLLTSPSLEAEMEQKLCRLNGCTVLEKEQALKKARNSLRTMIQNVFRDHQDIMDGRTAYSETLFYKIEKKRVSDNQVVQNIYISNNETGEAITYTDTQVNYGVEYEYTIYAYQAVVGTKYRYKLDQAPVMPTDGLYVYFPELNANPDNRGYVDIHTGEVIGPGQPVGDFLAKDWLKLINNIFASNDFTPETVRREYSAVNQNFASDEDKARVCVFSEASLVLVEVPQNKFVTKVIDKPPVEPDVDLVPYRGISNKLLINLNGGTGNYIKPFQVLENSDESLKRDYILNQRAEIQNGNMINVLNGGPFNDSLNSIEFRSDDPSTQFEIWRSPTMPKQWTDFDLVKMVDSSEFFDRPNQKASSATFVDDIVPNRNYWYAFRAVDVHGNKSNPTEIYKIFMHDDNGTVWLDIETVPYPRPPDPRTFTKNAKRFIQIKPNFNQTTINELESNFINQQTGERIQSLEAYNLTGDPVVLGDPSIVRTVWSDDQAPYKFKIRLTSKKTGRKIDINFYCTTKHIKNPNVKIQN